MVGRREDRDIASCKYFQLISRRLLSSISQASTVNGEQQQQKDETISKKDIRMMHSRNLQTKWHDKVKQLTYIQVLARQCPVKYIIGQH